MTVGLRYRLRLYKRAARVATHLVICRERLKEWRADATRYEKTAASFTGVLCLAATLDRLKR